MLARVSLGHCDLAVRAIGLGCMGMSQSYGDADDDVSAATIGTALDLGVDFLDTSDVYGASDITWGVPIRGFGHNEELIGRAIAARSSPRTASPASGTPRRTLKRSDDLCS
jgi:aryl-alcohol dehydrogenase-like predicted oxidoreductase